MGDGAAEVAQELETAAATFVAEPVEVTVPQPTVTTPETPMETPAIAQAAVAEDREAGATALAAIVPAQETVAVTRAAAAIVPAVESAVVAEPGEPAQGSALAAPAVARPAEPTHPVEAERAHVHAVVEEAVALVDAKDQPQAAPTLATRIGRHASETPGAAAHQKDAQPAQPVRTEQRQEAAPAPLAVGGARRESSGGQTGTSTDGGQTAHHGGTPTPTTAVAQPAAPTAEAAAAAKAEVPLRARARLAELADVAQTMIRVAARDGKATARITLRPVELGDVEIRLRYHAGGVSADVVAESRQAAQLLTSASAELRRSLESQGLTVHWLDVRAGTDDRREWNELGQPGGRRRAEAAAEETDEVTTIEASSLPVAAGAVDVLA